MKQLNVNKKWCMCCYVVLYVILESSLTIDIKKKDAHGNCHVVLHATSSDGMNKVHVNMFKFDIDK